MKLGEGTCTAPDGRVFVLWEDEGLHRVFGNLGLGVAETFTNASVLGTGEVWQGGLGGKLFEYIASQELAILAH